MISPGVLLLARVEVRRRWKSLVALGLLAGLVGAVVLGVLQGSRRTATAYDRLRETTGYWDVQAFFGSAPDDVIDEIVALPDVEASWQMHFSLGRRDPEPGFPDFGVGAGPLRPSGFYRPIVVEGRLPATDAADEVALSTRMEGDEGTLIHIGERIKLHGISPEQLSSFDDGSGVLPAGPSAELTVVGRYRDPGAMHDNAPNAMASAAFWDRYGRSIGGPEYLLVKVRGGDAAVRDFVEAANRIGVRNAHRGDSSGVFTNVVSFQPVDELAAGIYQGQSVLTRSLLIVAAVALLTGGLVATQAVSRHLASQADHQVVQSSLGLSRRERAAAAALPLVVTLAVGVVTAGIGAVVWSGRFPIGVARQAEPRPGLEANIGVLGPSVLLLVLLGGAVTTGLAFRHATPRAGINARQRVKRPRLFVIGPATAVGLDMATTRPAGRSSSPAGAAAVSGLVGLAGLLASLVFVDSIDRLRSTPAHYGANFDHSLLVADEQRQLLVERLASDPDVAAAAITPYSQVVVEGRSTTGYDVQAVKGALGLTVLSGRMPAAATEIALGPELAGQLGKGLGEQVQLERAGGGGTVVFDLVGTVLTPQEELETYDGGVALTGGALAGVRQSDGFVVAYLRLAPGANFGAVAARYAGPDDGFVRQVPDAIEAIAGARGLVVSLTAFFALLTVAALGHALVTTSRRRRRDVAIARSLGLSHRRVLGASAVCGSVLATAALAAGVPGGLLAGTGVWRRVARSLNVADDAALPLAATGAAAVAALASAILLALALTVGASRRSTTELLRAQ